MQIKFKKQIDIELDKSDLLEAVRDLLAKNGQAVTNEELEAVKFINSPQTGIRAELKITEESGDTASLINGTPTPVQSLSTKVTNVEGTITSQGFAYTANAGEPEPEAPGEIAPATVEDVAPTTAIERAVDLVLQAEPDAEEEVAIEETAVESAAPSAESLRTSLF